MGWPSDAAPAPWVLQQAGGIRSEAPEHFAEILMGVDVLDLVQQIRLLRQERKDLKNELQSMQHWNAKISTAEKISAVHRHNSAVGVRSSVDHSLTQFANVLAHEAQLGPPDEPSAVGAPPNQERNIA